MKVIKKNLEILQTAFLKSSLLLIINWMIDIMPKK